MLKKISKHHMALCQIANRWFKIMNKYHGGQNLQQKKTEQLCTVLIIYLHKRWMLKLTNTYEPWSHATTNAYIIATMQYTATIFYL